MLLEKHLDKPPGFLILEYATLWNLQKPVKVRYKA